MSALTQLNFPRFVFRMRLMENPPKIWDAVRRRWLVLTPEEWVRQHLVAYLVTHCGVPPKRIVEEYAVALNGQAQRADVVVVGDRGRDGPRRPAVPAGRMQGAGRAARSRSVRSGRAVQQRRGGPLCTDNERAAALLQQPRSFYRTLCGRGRPARFIPISGDLAIEAYIRPASPTWFSSIPFSVRRP